MGTMKSIILEVPEAFWACLTQALPPILESGVL